MVYAHIRVSEATACKMLPASLAKVFGPTIVGHSCPDPDPKLALKQLRKQHAVSKFSHSMVTFGHMD